MHNANWWMMALSFVLGLLLTLALMIRRVTREVPVSNASKPLPEVKKPAVPPTVVPVEPAKIVQTKVVETDVVAAGTAEKIEADVTVVEPVIVPSDAVIAESAATVVQEDHSGGDATMVIVASDALPPEATIRVISSD